MDGLLSLLPYLERAGAIGAPLLALAALVWGVTERKDRIRTQQKNDHLQDCRVADMKEQMEDFDALADKVIGAMDGLKNSFNMQRASVEQMLRGRR